MTGRGKKAAAKKDAVVPEVETPEAQAPLVAEAVEVSEAPEVKKGRGKAKAILEEAPVAEIKEMKGRGKKAQPPAKKKQKDKMVAEPEVAEKKDHDKKAHPSADSASQVASEVDTPEVRAPLVAEAVEVFEASEVKKVCGKAKAKSFMSRNSAPVPSRSSVENLDEPRERGRGKKEFVRAVSKVNSEEESVEEVKEAKAKKRVAVAKKPVEDKEQKSAVLEEVCAPAEVMETIESPETVPAKRSRGNKAAGKKDAVEEAVLSSEPEVAEKKGRGKKAHPSADSASQVASEVDNPDKINLTGMASTSGGRTLQNAFKQIDTMAAEMKLPGNVAERARNIFREIHDGKHLKGFSHHVILSSCLQIACRQEGSTRTFKENCGVSKITLKEIGRCFNLIRSALNIPLDIITPSDFIPRFCCTLGLPENVQMAVSHIARKAVEFDIVPGRSPLSVAATAIYMASYVFEKDLSQKQVSVATGVADVTIRQLYKLMYPRAKELVPEDFELDISRLPRPHQ